MYNFYFPSRRMIWLGGISIFIISSFSISLIVIEILYMLERVTYCNDAAIAAGITIDCSEMLRTHLYGEDGMNFLLLVASCDVLILIACFILAFKLRELFYCIQISFALLITVNLAFSIVSFVQMDGAFDYAALDISCSASSSNIGCGYNSIKGTYKDCLLPFSICQFMITLAYKVFMHLSQKRNNNDTTSETLKQIENNRQIEESTLNLPMYNSKGKQLTVRELYTMGKL